MLEGIGASGDKDDGSSISDLGGVSCSGGTVLLESRFEFGGVVFRLRGYYSICLADEQ